MIDAKYISRIYQIKTINPLEHDPISRLGTGLGWYLLERSWTKDLPKTNRSPVTIIE